MYDVIRLLAPKWRSFKILDDGLVLLVRRRGDDIPSVQQAGNKAKAAKGEVDQRVGRAEATLDPHGKGREDDSQESKTEVGG